MAVSLAKLRANARKLDRLRIQATTVLGAMKRGEALHLEFAWYGRVWRLSGGRHIDDDVAQVVIKNSGVADVGDALFGDVSAQTWRWVEIEDTAPQRQQTTPLTEEEMGK